ncbi:hypothetical protein [Pedobacter sp. KBW01]|uniref:hypothetical protein n=1 Tax=Pedobacter sp. KBW01 TaxID=2153364 RepID=UPI00131A005D|nr:hypothetical protein [Pedobacter sp. KBW01]
MKKIIIITAALAISLTACKKESFSPCKNPEGVTQDSIQRLFKKKLRGNQY